MSTLESVQRGPIIDRKPPILVGMPVWWHPKGREVSVIEFQPEQGLLRLGSKGATLKITACPRNGWYLEWEIRFYEDCKASGRIWFNDYHLLSAFGLKSVTSLGSEPLLDMFGGTCAGEKRFIRYHQFLNVPCPGTGHDGDPNISVEITSEMRGAIERLVQERLDRS